MFASAISITIPHCQFVSSLFLQGGNCVLQQIKREWGTGAASVFPARKRRRRVGRGLLKQWRQISGSCLAGEQAKHGQIAE